MCSAGGAFAYVGAMQDSFPHSLELSRRGYNAFALIYRPGAQAACEDLARAISFIFANAEELGVSTECYSLWGGSAGARMAAWLGSYGPAAFGGEELPRPGTVVMQYTGHSDYTPEDPPTFVCVGDSDWIADWRVMQRRCSAWTPWAYPPSSTVIRAWATASVWARVRPRGLARRRRGVLGGANVNARPLISTKPHSCTRREALQ